MSKIDGLKLFEWQQIDKTDDGTEILIMWATSEGFAHVVGRDQSLSSWKVNMDASIVLASGTSISLRAAKRHAEAVLISEYSDKAKEVGHEQN